MASYAIVSSIARGVPARSAPTNAAIDAAFHAAMTLPPDETFWVGDDLAALVRGAPSTRARVVFEDGGLKVSRLVSTTSANSAATFASVASALTRELRRLNASFSTAVVTPAAWFTADDWTSGQAVATNEVTGPNAPRTGTGGATASTGSTPTLPWETWGTDAPSGTGTGGTAGATPGGAGAGAWGGAGAGSSGGSTGGSGGTSAPGTGTAPGLDNLFGGASPVTPRPSMVPLLLGVGVATGLAWALWRSQRAT